jgi:hypothetical protein
MALMDEARTSATSGNVGAPAATASGSPLATAKEPGDSSPSSNYQAKKRQQIYQDALALQAALKRGNVALQPQEQEALDRLTRKPGEGRGGSGNFGKPVIYKVFGDTPKVGSTATALDIFQKTGKGYQEIAQLVKKWSEKGNIVKYDAATKTYTLTAVGILPANV